MAVYYVISSDLIVNACILAVFNKDSTLTQQETVRNHRKTQPCTVLADVVEVSAHYAVSLQFFLQLSEESGRML